MERGGGGGGGGYRRAGRNRGRGGQVRQQLGGGRGFHHQPQSERGRSWSGEETRRVSHAEPRGRGFHRPPQPRRGQSGTVPSESVHDRRPPSDPVPKLRMLQDQQGSTSSCMLEAKDKTLAFRRSEKGRTLTIGTNGFHVKFKPDNVTLQYDVDVKYRRLWSHVIDLAAVVLDKVLEWKLKKP